MVSEHYLLRVLVVSLVFFPGQRPSTSLPHSTLTSPFPSVWCYSPSKILVTLCWFPKIRDFTVYTSLKVKLFWWDRYHHRRSISYSGGPFTIIGDLPLVTGSVVLSLSDPVSPFLLPSPFPFEPDRVRWVVVLVVDLEHSLRLTVRGGVLDVKLFQGSVRPTCNFKLFVRGLSHRWPETSNS